MYQLKEERFKSFVCFDVTFYCKQACKLLILCIKGKQKRYFMGSFLNHMDPCAYLLKWSRYAPALYFLKSLPAFKALTVMADIMQSSALPMRSYALSVMHRMVC